MNKINTRNKVNTTITVAGATLFGTRFDTLLNDLCKAGYVNGWNKTSHGWVWFKTVGCCGYEYIPVSKNLRKDAIREARKLLRAPAQDFGSRYWSYKPEDEDLCARNARLWRENKVKFLAHLISDR